MTRTTLRNPRRAPRPAPGDTSFVLGLGAALGGATLWSVIAPHDLSTWFLEAAPVLVGGALLAVTYRAFRFTRLAYGLMGLHALILLVGAHYTYAEVPLFNGLRDALDLGRNHYDRLGHLAQGFVPAIVAREILIRRSPLKPGKWLFFLVTCVALAISAFYELIEWWVAVGAQDGAVAFLGTQGDPWDTQWDMFLALVGAVTGQLLLGPIHDRALSRLRA